MLVVSLVTRGSPDQVTGGHLYHRRMAAAAASRQATIEFVSVTAFRDPLRAAWGLPLVDSLAAWSVAPWVRRHDAPLAAILHQPPGGVGQGRVRTAVQRPADQYLYRRCALLIAASTALRDELVSTYHLPAERICVIEPGSDLPAVPPAGDLRAGRRIALLTVGNWVPNKGILAVLDAVAGLAPDLVTLHLAGRDDVDATYTKRVRARISAPDLASRVVVHGPVSPDDVAGLYRGADAFVLTSHDETYGTVYGEALSVGLPTIGWRSGNLRNLIDDGTEGCLLPPGDVAGLTDVLQRLASDDVWRSQLSTAARRRGERLPRWSDAADAFFAALRPLAASRG